MKKGGTIDLQSHLIYHTAWSSSKKKKKKIKIDQRGLFNTIFFIGLRNETALLLQKQ